MGDNSSPAPRFTTFSIYFYWWNSISCDV